MHDTWAWAQYAGAALILVAGSAMLAWGQALRRRERAQRRQAGRERRHG